MITMSIKSDYDKQGFVTGLEVIAPGKADYYAQQCKSFIDSYREHPDYSEWTYYRTELILKWVADLASEPSLLDAVEDIIGPDILLWNAFLPVKPPSSDAHFGWHQDATYWPVTPTEQMVSVWVALSVVDQSCGGMQMLRGSHLLGQLSHETTYDKTSMLKRGQQVTASVDEKAISNIDLQPGQASFHHTLTLHRSGPNHSQHWRLGVGFNYASAEVGPLPGHEDSAMPLRGDVKTSRFRFNHPPAADMDSAALEHYAEALQRQSKRYADVT